MKVLNLEWGMLVCVLFIVSLCLIPLLSSCTTDVPRTTKVNGSTCVQTDKRFLGMKYATETEYIKTKEQRKDDLEVEKEEREQELDLKTEERQSAAAFWIGLALLIAAPCCAIAGYVSSGWKFWGSLGIICGLLGIGFWSFEHLIPYLKWPAFGLVGAVILWTMWKLKDFSLMDKLKNSEPGKLL